MFTAHFAPDSAFLGEPTPSPEAPAPADEALVAPEPLFPAQAQAPDDASPTVELPRPEVTGTASPAPTVPPPGAPPAADQPALEPPTRQQSVVAQSVVAQPAFEQPAVATPQVESPQLETPAAFVPPVAPPALPTRVHAEHLVAPSPPVELTPSQAVRLASDGREVLTRPRPRAS
ncbi:hypothetical protein [Egicoccus sp. AB-alg6-2]|uniref:hypothetical protein n=1 Tax=Egicoccus sp. AB-alg6-2 TaxID=3242692 RepID=UPI00359D0CE0